MKVATYNVNGVNGRLPVLLRWLDRSRPDVVCLQELKAPQERFPEAALADAGYRAVWHGQKSWNGVAILRRGGLPVELRRGLPGDPDDLHSRYLEADIEGTTVACLYLPNGNPAPGPKFDYKLAWFKRLRARAARLVKLDRPVVLAGDFNVMPTELDVYKPENWIDDALFRPEVRRTFHGLVAQGWTDAVRTRSVASSAVWAFSPKSTARRTWNKETPKSWRLCMARVKPSFEVSTNGPPLERGFGREMALREFSRAGGGVLGRCWGGGICVRLSGFWVSFDGYFCSFDDDLSRGVIYMFVRCVLIAGDSQHDKAIIRVEYNMASFSTGERRQFSKRDRRFTERAALIRRTFESVVQLHLYPRSEICIAVQVLQTHGGELCVAINAVTLALVNAGIPLNSFLCACSAGLVDSTPLVDLNYVESTSGSPELIVAAQPETDEIVTSQLESKIPLEHLDSVLQLALAGCKLLHKSLSAAVESYSLSL